VRRAKTSDHGGGESKTRTVTGLLRVARYVVHNDLAQYLGVAIVEEGIALRTARILHPILAFTAPEPSQLSLYAHYGIDAAVTSIAAAKALNKIGASAGRKASVHVKIDTGMGRLGIAPADALEFFRSLRQMEHIDVRGIFTHFATSDDKDLSYTRKQLKSFTTLRRELTGLGFDIPLAHCANSAAIMRVKDAALEYGPTGHHDVWVFSHGIASGCVGTGNVNPWEDRVY